MIDFFLSIGTFALQTIIITVALMSLIVLIFSLLQKNKDSSSIKITNWNKKLKDYEKRMAHNFLSKKEIKNYAKSEKKQDKAESKASKPRSFVIDFNGDIKASAVDNFREAISAALTYATEKDEIVLRVESPGGMVHAYGLAASQIDRIKQRKIKLTICVDKVAASGGYMMACLADKLIAAPFAIIGSIGVVASVPNLHKILKKNDVDYMELTAGKYKRTITMLGEVTQEGKDKFHEQLEQTHVLFKNHVGKYRPQLDLEKVTTGEYWYGSQALDLKLVDELGTSDDYLMSLCKTHDVKEVSIKEKKGLKEKLTESMSTLLEASYNFLLNKVWSSQFKA